MPHVRALAATGCLYLALLTIGSSFAWSHQSDPIQDTFTKDAEAKQLGWLHEIYLQEASEYEFFLDEARRQKLELRREPVMRWIGSGSFNGDVYVWTHDGAVAVIGSIFSREQNNSRLIMHEFHSLSNDPLHGGGMAGSRWLPREPGITFEPLPDAPESAMNQALRLTQMRDMARRFTAQVDRRNERSKMRLLPQPLYRYEIKDATSRVVDGALFTFVWTVGTDPEVLVLIEAHRTDQGIRWFYAPARFTNRSAWLQYQGREVWHTEGATAGVFDGVMTKRYGASFVKTIPDREK